MNSSADTVKSCSFNVLNYGAVGDDKTDNTEAFSACLKALIEGGGGRMVLPAGVYCGRIIIPAIDSPKWIALEIVGESQPATLFGTIGRNELSSNNSIVKCLATSGPAVITAEPTSPIPGDFSRVHVVLRDLDVRTGDNPAIGGIDLEWASQCRIENVFVNTGVYNVQASKPTHGTIGLVTPACNNGALTILRNEIVTGFYTGIQVNEHTDGDNIVAASLAENVGRELLLEFLGTNVSINSQLEADEILIDLDTLAACEGYTELFSDASLRPFLSFWSDWDGSNRPSGQGHRLAAAAVMENVRRIAQIEETALSPEKQTVLRLCVLQIARLAGENG